MDGMWIKQCPRCKNYMKKNNPQDCAMCCACGWEEYVTTFYCEVAHRYCEFPYSEATRVLYLQEEKHLS
jgi:hypothetical protein